MHASVAEIFHDWHDFYLLAGTASATLVGLMFVAASIGSSIFGADKQSSMSAFLGSTVVHFSSVLFICILAAIPAHTYATFGGLITAAGLAGLIYSGRIWVQIFIRRAFATIDLIDRLFYGVIPVLGYLLVTFAGATLLMRSPHCPEALAVAVIVLLFAGIHNAWDMMSWMVLRSSAGQPAPPSGPPPTSSS